LKTHQPTCTSVFPLLQTTLETIASMPFAAFLLASSVRLDLMSRAI
jgi:hypothetical protein